MSFPKDINHKNSIGDWPVEYEMALIDETPDVIAKIFALTPQEWPLCQNIKHFMHAEKISISLIFTKLKQ